MALAIEPTPILRGADAKRFMELTLKAEREPDPKMAAFIKDCYELYLEHKF